MSDGHCLIVPMQHVTCGTQTDEDVWAEIQVARFFVGGVDLTFHNTFAKQPRNEILIHRSSERVSRECSLTMMKTSFSWKPAFT